VTDILFGIDPSSSAFGWGEVFADGPCIISTVGGVIFPAKKSAPAIERIASMIEQLDELIHDRTWTQGQIKAAIVEITSGKVAKRHKGGGAGLGVYGMAVGAAWQACRTNANIGDVVTVTENEWTQGKRKETRRIWARAFAPLYEEQIEPIDKGLDAADGICLTHWYARHRGLM
jgi:hypothetical protein